MARKTKKCRKNTNSKTGNVSDKVGSDAVESDDKPETEPKPEPEPELGPLFCGCVISRVPQVHENFHVVLVSPTATPVCDDFELPQDDLNNPEALVLVLIPTIQVLQSQGLLPEDAPLDTLFHAKSVGNALDCTRKIWSSLTGSMWWKVVPSILHKTEMHYHPPHSGMVEHLLSDALKSRKLAPEMAARDCGYAFIDLPAYTILAYQYVTGLYEGRKYERAYAIMYKEDNRAAVAMSPCWDADLFGSDESKRNKALESLSSKYLLDLEGKDTDETSDSDDDEPLTDLETSIMCELNGQAFIGKDLAANLAVELSTVKGACGHLEELEKVKNKRGLGYYRPDAKPPKQY